MQTHQSPPRSCARRHAHWATLPAAGLRDLPRACVRPPRRPRAPRGPRSEEHRGPPSRTTAPDVGNAL